MEKVLDVDSARCGTFSIPVVVLFISLAGRLE